MGGQSLRDEENNIMRATGKENDPEERESALKTKSYI